MIRIHGKQKNAFEGAFSWGVKVVPAGQAFKASLLHGAPGTSPAFLTLTPRPMKSTGQESLALNCFSDVLKARWSPRRTQFLNTFQKNGDIPLRTR